jgi:hypothetical protein
MMVKKLHPIKFYTTPDEEVIAKYKELEAVRNLPDVVSDFRARYQELCEEIRKEIGTKNLIGLTYSPEQNLVGIVEYPLEVEHNVYHKQMSEDDDTKYIMID